MLDTKFPAKEPNAAPQNPYTPSGPPEPLMFEEFAGMNTATTRPGVDDKQMYWCDGFIPLGPRRYLRTLYGVGPAIFAIPGPPPPPEPQSFIALVSNSEGELLGILTSPDGITWTPGDPPLTNGDSALVTDAFFIIGGQQFFNASKLLTSPDAVTWTEQTTGFGDTGAAILGLAFGNGLYVAVGFANGPVGELETSPDAITWTSRTTGFDSIIYSVTYGNGLYLAGGQQADFSARLEISSDGISWAEQAQSFGNPGSVSSLAYGAGIYVAVGVAPTGGEIETSPDGAAWTPQSQGFGGGSSQVFGVAFGNGTFVAVGINAAGDAEIESSTDGVTWTTRVTAFGSASSANSVTFSGGLFVIGGTASGGLPHLETAPDGITWTARTATYPDESVVVNVLAGEA